MKKVLTMLLVLALLSAFTACGAAPTQTAAPTPIAETEAPAPSPTEAPTLVTFHDAALETKVRAAMNRPDGEITVDEVAAVTELNLSNEWQPQFPEEVLIKDIDALKYFTNLTALDLTFNAITDISPLAGLTKMQSLKLPGNRIEDIGPLSGMTALYDLHIWGNQITDISPLSGMTELTSLFMFGNQITDISVVANMKKLDLLAMDNNQVTDISALIGLPLTRLRLNGNPIADFGPIKDIYPKLTEKDFEVLDASTIPNDPIEIAEPQFEKALRSAMNIHDRPITMRDAYLTQSLALFNEKSEDTIFSDITPLKYFVNLTSLEFNSNRISDLSPLAGLTKLKSLNVSFNQVKDLSPLAGLTQLERLQLNNNKIADVTPLAGLKSLKALSLRDNPITDWSPLKDIATGLESKDFEIK